MKLFRKIFSRASCGLVALLTASTAAWATSAAPSKWPAPYVCTRNFYVNTSGSDSHNCTDNGANACATILGATNNIALTGGDCVNVGPGTYNTGGTINLYKSGSNAHQDGNGKLTGYVAYIGAPNHASIIRWTQGTGDQSTGLTMGGSFVAVDGFELDGNQMGGCLVCQGGSHHIWFLNNIAHDSGGGGPGFGGNGDYFFVYHNEVYNTSWLASNAQSGIGVFQPIANGQTVSDGVSPADTQTFHIQFVGNVLHENSCSQTHVGIPGGHDCGTHSDGNGLQMDDFPNFQRGGACGDLSFPCVYQFQTLVMGNLSYHNGGRGISILGGNGFTVINNTAYSNCQDLGAGCGDVADVFGLTNSVFDNNIAWTNFSGANAFVVTPPFGRPYGGNKFVHNLTFDGTAGHIAWTIGDPTDSAAFPGNNALIGTDPKLTNVGTGNQVDRDFHPISGSPVLGAGFTISGLPGSNSTPDGVSQPNPPAVGSFTSSGAPPSSTPLINAGGPAAAPYAADTGFTGGNAVSNNPSGAVDTSLVFNPAPTAVYRTERYGNPFTYTVGGLTASTNYAVRLHFSEDFPADEFVGKRIENVSANGTQVLTNFDIFATAGAANKAVVQSFQSASDASGNIAITFSTAAGSVEANAKVDGIEVASMPTASLSASPQTVTGGGSSTLTWASTNSTRCIGTGFSTGSATSGSLSVTPTTSTTYSVACDAGGIGASASTTVSTPTAPTALLSATQTTILNGQSTTLTWSSTNSTRCLGTGFSTGNATSGSAIVIPTATTIYSVACDSGGVATSANVQVIVNPITSSLLANPQTITNGQHTILSWSTNGTRCVGAGFSTGGTTSGSLSVSPITTTPYSVSCDAGGAATLASISVTVNPAGIPAPQKTISDIRAEISSFFADNTTGAITPSILRSVMQDFLGSVGFNQYKVETLPIGSEGMTAFATNGRKAGELAGLGTGVPVYYSNGFWRVLTTDAPVQS